MLHCMHYTMRFIYISFPQFLDPKYSKFTGITKEIPLHNHRVGHLPEAAVTKLTEIELLLRRFTMTNDYPILDAALENYRMKFQ